jgi:hypothetical protein
MIRPSRRRSVHGQPSTPISRSLRVFVKGNDGPAWVRGPTDHTDGGEDEDERHRRQRARGPFLECAAESRAAPRVSPAAVPEDALIIAIGRPQLSLLPGDTAGPTPTKRHGSGTEGRHSVFAPVACCAAFPSAHPIHPSPDTQAAAGCRPRPGARASRPGTGRRSQGYKESDLTEHGPAFGPLLYSCDGGGRNDGRETGVRSPLVGVE